MIAEGPPNSIHKSSAEVIFAQRLHFDQLLGALHIFPSPDNLLKCWHAVVDVHSAGESGVVTAKLTQRGPAALARA